MLDVLYQDDDLVVINKPAGMLVHRSKLDARETVFVMQTLRDQLDRHVFPVHRLDKPTSGLLVFALSADCARALNQQFIEKRVSKHYLALVRGYTEDAGEVDYPLKEKLDKIADKKARQDKPAQEAVSEYRTLAKTQLHTSVGRYPTARYSLLELQPKTGRKHQLRRHMSHLRHPIIGDVNYGDTKHNKFYRQQLACRRLMLMAYRIVFSHPYSGQKVDVQVDADKAFADLFRIFEWPELGDMLKNTTPFVSDLQDMAPKLDAIAQTIDPN